MKFPKNELTVQMFKLTPDERSSKCATKWKTFHSFSPFTIGRPNKGCQQTHMIKTNWNMLTNAFFVFSILWYRKYVEVFKKKLAKLVEFTFFPKNSKIFQLFFWDQKRRKFDPKNNSNAHTQASDTFFKTGLAFLFSQTIIFLAWDQGLLSTFW